MMFTLILHHCLSHLRISIDWKNTKEYPIKKGDSIQTNNGTVIFTGVEQSDGKSIGLKNTTLAKALLL